MKHWLTRTPHTAGDWLLLIAAGAAVWSGLNALPGAVRGIGTMLAVFLPFLGGLALAYVLDIPARFFAARLFGGRRGPGIALAYLCFFGALGALVGLVVPQLLASVASFAANLPQRLADLLRLLDELQTRFGIDTAPITAFLRDSGPMLQQLLGRAPALAGAAADAAGRALDAVVALAASAYLLAGKQGLLAGARAAVRAALPPAGAGSVFAVCALANRTFAGYIGGQLLDAALVGGETFLLMLVLRLPYAPLIAVLVGATNIIPILGPYLGAAPGALLLLLGGNPWQAVEFLIAVLVIQQIDGNFVAPRILGDATGLSGLWVLVAIVVGGAWFGVAGMVVGVPVLGVAAALFKAAVGAGLTARGIGPDGAEEKPGGENS